MSECEHEEYEVENEEKDWIDAYCEKCGARLIFSLVEVQPKEDEE